MKKHLSRIVSDRLLVTILMAFLGLMTVTVIVSGIYEKRTLDHLIKTSLKNTDSIALNRNDMDIRENAGNTAQHFDQSYKKGTEFINEFLEFAEYSNESERNIIDRDGVIVLSSRPENVGFDMYSDPDTARIIEEIRNSSDTYVHSYIVSPISSAPMKYCGTFLPSYGGYFLEGYTKEAYDELKHFYFTSQIRYDNIGRSGYFLLLHRDGRIESSSYGKYDGETLTLKEDIMELPETGRIGKADFFGTESYVAMLQDEEELIVAVYPVKDVWMDWKISISIMLLLYSVVFAVLFLATRVLIADTVVKGVYSLNGSLKSITAGNLEERADFRDSVEFDELSDGINFMVDRMKGLIKEAEEQIDAELALAARIQTAFLPHVFPAFPERDEFDLYAAMIPAKEVGGDFYDFFLVDDDHLALVMGDVSGKGIPAALFMVNAKDKIRYSVTKHGSDVAEAIREVNLELMKENDAQLFVTVWLGVVTISTGHLDYVNAGHEYPALSRGGTAFTVPDDVHSVPVAARKKAKFEAGSIELGSGDILYLYTDGVTEANNPQEEMFQRSRMLDALNRDRNASLQEIDSNVKAAIAEFVRDAPQFDDTTTLCFKYLGKGSHHPGIAD